MIPERSIVIAVQDGVSISTIVCALARSGGTFSPRENDNFGGLYYYSNDFPHGEMYVFQNRDPIDGEPYYDIAGPTAVVLRIDNPSSESAAISRAISAALGVRCQLVNGDT